MTGGGGGEGGLTNILRRRRTRLTNNKIYQCSTQYEQQVAYPVWRQQSTKAVLILLQHLLVHLISRPAFHQQLDGGLCQFVQCPVCT